MSKEKMLAQYLDRQIELDRVRVSKVKGQSKFQLLTKEISEYADKLLFYPQIKEFTQIKSKTTFQFTIING